MKKLPRPFSKGSRESEPGVPTKSSFTKVMSNTDTSSSSNSPTVPLDSSHYPPPLIVEPSSGTHLSTWIILHGRGDRAHSFALGPLGLLNIPLPNGKTLPQHLPATRFVFPTASHRRARVFEEMSITQWFDIYSWNSLEHLDWQREGLKQTTEWVHELVRREGELVGGVGNVVLGGLSQGCASVLVSVLLWSGRRLGGMFGLSGWLPFRHVLEGEVRDEDVEEEEEGMGGSFGEHEGSGKQNRYQRAVKALCEELEVDVVESEVMKQIPIFIAHGGMDEKVDTHLGSEAAECLKKLGCNVQYKEYSTLVHWMRGDELSDVADFVDLHVGNKEHNPLREEEISKTAPSP